ncbi:hypothetical protein CDD80_6298 [Ophiocordyceps camponoti-rufipedis]|uniref:Mitochondrial zinc maintenance protein 1, mitochondrial n=1 Tax=Ophiocordyceps camponoti-rufipedis TaxID=2004952 RepID=A0A2C5ZCK3_9HYPO|nr:hypothetical protein CDD80_6298 [Ophiocordyceps camponoti-rufipedis]
MSSHVYRDVLRAARIAFRGDDRVLTAAKQQIQHAFRQSSSLEPSSQEAQKAIQHAKDVAQILRSNVVQGRREGPDKDTYSQLARFCLLAESR